MAMAARRVARLHARRAARTHRCAAYGGGGGLNSNGLHFSLPICMLEVSAPSALLCALSLLTRGPFLSRLRTTYRRGGGLFVDSGANEGMWSLLAAAHGCTAIAIEPQPYCATLIRAAAERSGLLSASSQVGHSVQLHMKVYGDDHDASRRPCVPNDICRGTATYAQGRVSDIRQTNFSVSRDRPCTVVPFVSLDELLPADAPPIDLWHLDVEGAELVALRSARRLLSAGRVRRVMMEVDSMQRWRLNLSTKLTIDQTLAEVRSIFDGWKCVRACDGAPYAFPTHFRWGQHAQCPNVYCVAPGVDEDASTSERRYSTHTRSTTSNHL